MYHQQLHLLCFCCCLKGVFGAELRVLMEERCVLAYTRKFPWVQAYRPWPHSLLLLRSSPGQPQRLGWCCRNQVRLLPLEPLPPSLSLTAVPQEQKASTVHTHASPFRFPFAHRAVLSPGPYSQNKKLIQYNVRC